MDTKELKVEAPSGWPFWLAVVVLTVLCAGTPDLLDAIIAWVGRQP